MKDKIILNKERYKKKVDELNDVYWLNTYEARWIYMGEVICEIHKINPEKILEIGSYKINLTNFSDNMDLSIENIDIENIHNKKYIQSATKLPWKSIPDKYYDIVIALQVFEHFVDKKQEDVFREIQRISKHAILSFPYKWDKPEDLMHHNITDDVLNKWTCGLLPEKIIQINKPISRKRIIYFFDF